VAREGWEVEGEINPAIDAFKEEKIVGILLMKEAVSPVPVHRDFLAGAQSISGNGV
jgi:hypothetical protein